MENSKDVGLPYGRIISGLLTCLALAIFGCESPSNSEPVKNSDAAILRFSVGEAVGAISGTGIVLWLPPETDKTSLSPEIILSQGATVRPPSGSSRNFSASLAYTVTAEDGSVQDYTVRISSEDLLRPPPFDSLAALAAYLSDFTGKNNRENPVRVAFTDAVDLAAFKAPSRNGAGDDPLGALFDALNGKYARLDLSACAGTVLDDSQAGIFWTRNNRGNLTGIVLPEGLVSLGAYVFSGCYSLEECVVPAVLAGIGERAFSGCDSLETLDLEAAASLTALGDYAFAEWTGLAGITLPEGLASIGTGVFQGCVSLAAVELPASLVSIGPYAFRGCAGLTSLTLLKTDGVVALGNANAFEGTPLSTAGGGSIYVPAALLEDYQAARVWNVSGIKDNLKAIPNS
jgi:hypothetical protein